MSWKTLIMSWMLSSTIMLAQTQPASPSSSPSPENSTQGSTILSPVPTSLERIQAALNQLPTDVSSIPTPSPAIPANFAGAGALYNPSGSPRVTGWATYAKLVDAKSESYFFTTEDAFVSPGTSPFTVTVSGRVGLATKIKEIGPVKVFGIVDGGGATAGSASGAAASGGGIATIKLKGAYYLLLGYRALVLQHQSGTPKLYELGFGKAW